MKGEGARGEPEKELEPTRTSVVAFVTPDLKSGLSPNLRTYRGSSVFQVGKADCSLSTRGLLHNHFHGQTCKTPGKDLKPSTPPATRSSVPGPGKAARRGERVPAALLLGHQGGVLQPAAQESLDQSRWLEGAEEVSPW